MTIRPVLPILLFAVALPTGAQEPPAALQVPPPQLLGASGEFHQVIAIIVDAPESLRPPLVASLTDQFGKLEGAVVEVFDDKWESVPNWVISVSADVSGTSRNARFVMSFAFSRAVSFVDGDGVLRGMKGSRGASLEMIQRLLEENTRPVSDFKAMWLAQGEIGELDIACKKAASIFDSLLLAYDRRAAERSQVKQPSIVPPKPPGPK